MPIPVLRAGRFIYHVSCRLRWLQAPAAFRSHFSRTAPELREKHQQQAKVLKRGLENGLGRRSIDHGSHIVPVIVA